MVFFGFMCCQIFDMLFFCLGSFEFINLIFCVVRIGVKLMFGSIVAWEISVWDFI